MKKLKQLFADFKKFITKGNVVDMAVGVILGSAFTAIVNSVTKDIIMPLVNWAVKSATGNQDLSEIRTILYRAVDETGALDVANSIIINWGTLINAVLNFFLIAIVLFSILKFAMGFKQVREGITARTQKKIEKLAKKLAKKGMTEEEAQKQAEAALAAQAPKEPPAPPKPTTEELLAEIRDLLAANAKKD